MHNIVVLLCSIAVGVCASYILLKTLKILYYVVMGVHMVRLAHTMSQRGWMTFKQIQECGHSNVLLRISLPAIATCGDIETRPAAVLNPAELEKVATLGCDVSTVQLFEFRLNIKIRRRPRRDRTQLFAFPGALEPVAA